MFPLSQLLPRMSQISAVLEESSLNGYLDGILNTILFMRLLDPIDTDFSFSHFLKTNYPSTRSSQIKLPTCAIEASSWINECISEIHSNITPIEANNLTDAVHSIDSLFAKVLLSLKFYVDDTDNNHRSKRCESWLIDLDILRDQFSSSFFDREKMDTLKSNKSINFNNLNSNSLLYLSLNPSFRQDFLNDLFQSNISQIIQYVDSHRENVPIFKSTKSPFLLDYKIVVTSSIYTNPLDIEDLASSFPGLDSNESIEVLSSLEYDKQKNEASTADDLWKNGYNIIRKILDK